MVPDECGLILTEKEEPRILRTADPARIRFCINSAGHLDYSRPLVLIGG